MSARASMPLPPDPARIVAAVAALASIAALSGAARAPAAPVGPPTMPGDHARGQAGGRSAAGPFNPLVGDADYGTGEAAFGAARAGHMHEGQDMFAATGTALVAVADGVVLETGADAGRGNYLAIYDPRREHTYVYFHMLDAAAVRAGERVEAGTRVGALGCTGSCWGPHLHFEVRDGRDPYGQAIDPMPLLRRWTALPERR